MKENLTQGNIARSLIRFTVPLVLSGLLQQLFNWVDAFIVGNVEGELALAGIGATSSLYNLFVTVLVGFTSGISVFAAQKYGSGDERVLKKLLSSFALLLVSVSLAMAVVGICFAQPILTVMNTPDDIFSIGKDYLQIILLGVPILAIYNTYSAVLRGVGDSRAPFLAITVCSAVNVILDLVFVAGFRWGAAGAALATVIAQGAMTIFVVLCATKRYSVLSFRRADGLLDLGVVLAAAQFGFPPAIQSAVISGGNMILQSFMNSFGEQTVAAITTAYRVDSMILLPIVNFGSGIATIVAQNVGAQNPGRAKAALKIGAGMNAGISLMLTGVVLVLGRSLIAMFGLTEESVKIGTSFFYAIASCYVVYGLAMAARGYLEGCGDMLFSGITSILSLGVRIVASYAFAGVFGNMVIAYAEAFAWVVLLLIYLGRYYTRYGNLRRA